MSMLEDKQILVIDEAPAIRKFLKLSLEDEGAVMHEAATARDGLALCKNMQPDAIIMDLGLPDMEGLDALPLIKEKYNSIPVIILTVRRESDMLHQAKKNGATAYLNKPFMVDELINIVQQVI